MKQAGKRWGHVVVIALGCAVVTWACDSPTDPSIVVAATCPASSVPPGTTAICKDFTNSHSANRLSACSSHGGVSCWVCPGPLC